MREVEIKGIWYHIESLSAMNQLYVARRVGPLLLNVARSALTGAPEAILAQAEQQLSAKAPTDPAPSLASSVENAQETASGEPAGDSARVEMFMKMIAMTTVVYGPFIEQLSQMKDEDLNFIVMTCLGVCKRRDGDKWAPLISSDGRSLMYQDMKIGQMMQLTAEVIRDNIADFFEVLSGAA